MSEGEWFYVVDGQQQGPVPFEELRSRAVRGDLERPHLVWKDGMADWQPAGSVEGLFSGVEQPPSPTAPTWRPEVAPPPAVTGPPGIVIAGFVITIVSLFVCVPFALVGGIMCAIGLPEANRRGGSGKGLAIAGIVISAVLLVATLGFVVFVIFAASAGSGGGW